MTVTEARAILQDSIRRYNEVARLNEIKLLDSRTNISWLS